MSCPLCHSTDKQLFYQDRLHEFWQCDQCFGLYRAATNILSAQEEKERYLTHNNDVNDKGYRNFVAPFVNHITQNFTTEQTGLDYGAGTGPVAAVMLEEQGYAVKLYDPFFHPDPSPLKKPYDFIICCEVMEHFHQPDLEFAKLKSLLKPKGQLICKTDLYDGKLNFEKWYYKNDPTHVFIYHPKSLEFLAVQLDLDLSFIDHRTPVFTRLS
ncbi:class I SAM-dependent methyltransferase [Gilvibacter sediminis]|uniref:class I SAM-dependent methyltransferase n=1 Tax=Gilvibacter sediminis TaxID=379071 RepID=UPI0023505FE0|nr:class I SAM-dependent methyltransferase [Gilvibacter sediminis]MDC7998879.1 class I SAM-dependent methyltransferase [Gilvibacter sediminis]